jgi:YHS domain-containing protein
VSDLKEKCSNMKHLVVFLAFSFVFYPSYAQNGSDQPRSLFNVTKDGLAIKGYDPVAYFTLGKAVPGNKELTWVVTGIIYRFSTTQNRDLFKANPAKYAPQYGGWCAYAMGASGDKVEIDPETFKITDGKLFLFYHSWVNNTLNKWNADEAKLHAKADVNWSKIDH